METESVPTLIGRLCDVSVERLLQRNGGESPVDVCLYEHQQSNKRKLKACAFDTIFRYLRERRCRLTNRSTSQDELRPIDHLYGRVFQLRLQRKFDDASKLESLLRSLDEDGYDETISSILHFLVSLQDSNNKDQSSVIGHSSSFGHTAISGQSMKNVMLPSGPLMYGDTKLDIPITSHYMHFPREIFEKSCDNELGIGHSFQLQSEIFTMKPGTQLQRMGLFTDKVSKNDVFTHDSQTSLFGALVQSRVMSLDVRLEIPDMADGVGISMPQFRKSRLTESTEDEGFVDAHTSQTESPSSVAETDSGFDEDIWSLAVNHKLSKHYTWEDVGRRIRYHERPYLTEAGRHCFDEMRRLYVANRLLMISVSLSLPVERCVSVESLVADIRQLLIAVPSHSFIWHEGRFHISEGLFVSGISPESLRHQCSSLLCCGTYFKRLTEFSQARQPRSLENFGLIVEAFRKGVRQYLQYYRACVLSMPISGQTPMKITVMMRKVFEQMRYLAKLCRVDVTPSDGNASSSLPTGYQLLTLLYNECILSSSCLHYPMLLSLLASASLPYLCMIHGWLFHGRCRDDFGEFMLQPNQEYIGRRDELYWSMSYSPTADNISSAVPGFLADIASDIFVCGKSINLLKLCAAGKHFLFDSESDLDAPPLHLSFRQSELNSSQQHFTAYFSRVQAVAKQRIRTRAEVKLKAEQARNELSLQVRQAATERLHRLQDKALEVRVKYDTRKRQQFSELKEEMLRKMRQRLAEKEEEREKDKAFVDAAHEKDLLQASISAELQQQARDELISHYQELNDEADRRLKRAQWQIDRHKLDEKRTKFLHDELLAIVSQDDTSNQIRGVSSSRKQSSETSVGASRDGDSVVASGSSSETTQHLAIADTSNVLLPQWARRAFGDDDVNGGTVSEDVSSRPASKWAVVAQDAADEDTVCLPSWAARGIAGGQLCMDVASGSESTEDILAGDKVDDDPGHATGTTTDGVGNLKEKSDLGLHGQLSLGADVVSGQHIGLETVQSEEILHVKMVPDHHTGEESSEVQPTAHVKMVAGKHVSMESNPLPVRSMSTDVRADGVSECGEEIPGSHSCAVESEGVENDPHVVATEDLINVETDEVCTRLSAIMEEPTSGGAAEGCVAAVVDASGQASKTDLSTPIQITSDDSAITQQHKTVFGASAGATSDDADIQKATRNVAGQYIGKMSEESAEVRHVRAVPECHVCTESEEPVDRSHIRMNADVNIATESSETETRICMKRVEGKDVNMETTSSDHRSHIKVHPDMCSTTESNPTELDMQISAGIPRLKRTHGMDSSRESDWAEFTSYQVRRTMPCRQKVIGQSIERESSTAEVAFRSHLKMSKSVSALTESKFVDTDAIVRKRFLEHNVHGSAVTESEHVDNDAVRRKRFLLRNVHGNAMDESEFMDTDAIRRKRFLEHNVHGHAADSTVQELLYGQINSHDSETVGASDQLSAVGNVSQWADQCVEPYQDNFCYLDDPPAVDLMANQQFVNLSAIQHPLDLLPKSEDGDDLETHKVTSLSVLVHRCILMPIQAQVSLVNDIIVNYFMVDINMDGHFVAIRRYLLLQDGEFAQSLTDQLFDKLASYKQPHQLLNPVYLNNVLRKAFASSVQDDTNYNENVAFLVKHSSRMVSRNVIDILDNLLLTYKVNFPANLIVTDDCMNKYSQIFTFMLQLKRAVWVLQDIFHRIKRDAQAKTASANSEHMRAIQQYRAEMQHFVRVLHEYIANQVISVSWHEFQADLGSYMNGLDDLHHRHATYLNKCLYRCLLNRKAAPILKIILNIFGFIQTFSSQLSSQTWHTDPVSNQLCHPSFDYMRRTYHAFHSHSLFLFKVVDQMVARSSQPHFEELLLRLNFNGFYKPFH